MSETARSTPNYTTSSHGQRSSARSDGPARGNPSVITMFSVSGCSSCQRLRAIVAERGWPMVELSLTTYPHLRSDMLQLTDRLVAPQLFFNNFYVGNYAEVRKLADSGELHTLHDHFIKLQDFSYSPQTTRLTRKQRGERELRVALIRLKAKPLTSLHRSTSPPAQFPNHVRRTSVSDDQTIYPRQSLSYTEHQSRRGREDKLLDVRLVPPDFAALEPKKIPPFQLRSQKVFIGPRSKKEGEKLLLTTTPLDISSTTHPTGPEEKGTDKLTTLVGVPVSALLTWFLHHLPIHDRKRLLKAQRKCFDGADLIRALETHMGYAPEDTGQICQALLDKDLLRSLSDSSAFNPLALYRLQLHEDPMMLNTAVVFTGKLSAKPVKLLRLLRQALHDIIASHTSSDGLVDYVAAREDRRFLEFVVATTELQRVELAQRTHDKVLSFVINSYNLAVQHAFVQVGIPQSFLAWRYFFNNVGYCIGGHRYTLNELESGLLGGNKRTAFRMTKPFGSKDARASIALKKPDCRIHLAMNRLSDSKPFIDFFAEEAIDEELRLTAMAFFENDRNLSVDISTATVYLSKVIDWYRRDFGNGPLEICQRILGWCRGSKGEKMSLLVDITRADNNPMATALRNAPVTSSFMKSGLRVKFVPFNWTTNAKRSANFTSTSCL